MPGVAQAITIDDAAIHQALQNLAAFPGSLAPALEEIGEAMVSSTRLNFADERSPDGAAWLKSKRALRDGGKTLQLTRRLINSIVSQLVAGAGGEAGGVEWGTNVVYAAIHQFGGTIARGARTQSVYRNVSKAGELSARFVKRRQSNFETRHDVAAHAINIPARPYIGIGAEDIETISETLNRHLAASINGAPA